MQLTRTNKNQPSILLIEDEKAHQELFVRQLIEFPFNLKLADSLALARNYLKSEPFDLVVCDMFLPDGRGIDLLSDSPGLPVFFVTSQGNEAIAVEAIKAGALDYFVKDETLFEKFPRLLENALNQKRRAKTKGRPAQDATRHFQTFLDSIFFPAVSLDRAGLITYINPAFAQKIGYSSNEILGRQWFSLIPTEWAAKIRALHYGNIKNHLTHIAKYPVLCKDGTVKLVTWNNTLIFSKRGKITGTISIGQDGTNSEEIGTYFTLLRMLLEDIIQRVNVSNSSEDIKGVANDLNKSVSYLDMMAFSMRSITLDFPAISPKESQS